MITRKELQSLYNVCPDTLRPYLKKAGILHRSRITPLEFELLKKMIGEPLKVGERK